MNIVFKGDDYQVQDNFEEISVVQENTHSNASVSSVTMQLLNTEYQDRPSIQNSTPDFITRSEFLVKRFFHLHFSSFINKIFVLRAPWRKFDKKSQQIN